MLSQTVNSHDCWLSLKTWIIKAYKYQSNYLSNCMYLFNSNFLTLTLTLPNYFSNYLSNYTHLSNCNVLSQNDNLWPWWWRWEIHEWLHIGRSEWMNERKANEWKNVSTVPVWFSGHGLTLFYVFLAVFGPHFGRSVLERCVITINDCLLWHEVSAMNSWFDEQGLAFERQQCSSAISYISNCRLDNSTETQPYSWHLSAH